MQYPKVYLNPVGCPKANVDLERVAWLLQHSGYEIVCERSEATIAVVPGCAFIDDAKLETIDSLLDLARLKREGALEYLIVFGCLPEKYGEETSREMPEVDALVGNSRLAMLPAVIGQLRQGSLHSRVLVGGDFAQWGRDSGRRAPSAAPWTRTLMISDGCDNACTYCSIPHMRGPLRSRSPSEIVGEAQMLVEQGAKEIILAGQDIAAFGMDRGRRELAELTAQLAREVPAEWIRLSYVNPDNLQPELGEVMSDHRNVCKYLDIPIQHASRSVLEHMGRRPDPEALKSLIRGLRDVVPDIALRTSVIVGFPGETESDFEELLTLMIEVQFDLVGVFTFSPQPGTPGAGFDNQVPEEVAEARLIEAVALQEGISRDKMRHLVGQTLKVLVEDNPLIHCNDGRLWCSVASPDATALSTNSADRGNGRLARGRTQYDMPEIDRVVHLTGCSARPGDFVEARIDDVTGPYEWSATCL
jgi:ribosomal protein S12 methylthiotransferase